MWRTPPASGVRMILLLLSYLAGVLTIVSPCILPVLPFVFARADRPFVRNGLPLLVGMALTFAGVASLAALGGGWAVRANEVGRWIALAVMAALGLSLLIPAVGDRLMRPFVAAGSWLTDRVQRGSDDRGKATPGCASGSGSTGPRRDRTPDRTSTRTTKCNCHEATLKPQGAAPDRLEKSRRTAGSTLTFS